MSNANTPTPNKKFALVATTSIKRRNPETKEVEVIAPKSAFNAGSKEEFDDLIARRAAVKPKDAVATKGQAQDAAAAAAAASSGSGNGPGASTVSDNAGKDA